MLRRCLHRRFCRCPLGGRCLCEGSHRLLQLLLAIGFGAAKKVLALAQILLAFFTAAPIPELLIQLVETVMVLLLLCFAHFAPKLRGLLPLPLGLLTEQEERFCRSLRDGRLQLDERSLCLLLDILLGRSPGCCVLRLGFGAQAGDLSFLLLEQGPQLLFLLLDKGPRLV